MLTKEQLKELVKQHFNLVEAPEVVTEEVTEEKFGEIADENEAFLIVFPGDTLEVGTPVTVKTEEGQEAPAPDGYHKLKNGKTIKVEAGVVTEIADTETEEKEEEMEEVPAEEPTKEEMSAEVVEEPVVAEESVSTEEIIEAVAEVVKTELASMKAELELVKAEFKKMSVEPASERTLPIPVAKFDQGFNIDTAHNAELIKKTIEQIKNKK